MPAFLRPLTPCLVLLAAVGWSPQAPAQSGIHRCTGANGQTVYSDRRCEDLGAASRMPPPALRDGETGLYRYGCPRRLSELVGLLRTAIETHDVNRLSSLYLWNDIADPAANRILGQLEAIADRPLLDIAPMYPEAAYEAETWTEATTAPAPSSGDGGADATLSDDDASAAAAVQAQAHEPAQVVVARPRPWGLRLEQMLADGSTPSRTVLRLRRQYNCFWVSF